MADATVSGKSTSNQQIRKRNMPREKKDARYLNIKLSSYIYDQLDRFCEETNLNKTAATEIIMERFFEEYFDKPEKERGHLGQYVPE